MKHPAQLDLQVAITNALVARELGELTRSRLPVPLDFDAEWLVLGALYQAAAGGILRREAKPEWFFLHLHRALFTAVQASPAEGLREVCVELAKIARLGADEDRHRKIVDLVSLLGTVTYTAGELAESMARLEELSGARALVEELERHALALRIGGATVEDVHRSLRRRL